MNLQDAFMLTAEQKTIPTGLPALTEALGLSGWPRGYVTEIFGSPAIDRGVVLVPTIRAAQRAGYVVALLDMACAFDPQAAEAAGVNVGALLVSQPDTLGQALEIAVTLVRSGAVEMVVLDGLNAGPLRLPRASDDPVDVGHVARVLSQAFRKITASAKRTEVAVLATTAQQLPQSRRLGESTATEADPHQALKFYASLRVELRLSTEAVTARVVKNKLAAPFREAVLETLKHAKA